MSESQEEAAKQAVKLLTAHFDAFCINVKNKNENLRTSVDHYWHGDITDVIGLNRVAVARLENQLCTRVANQ